MNIRDSYIHGADGKGVVKSLYFATSAESVSKADFSDNYTTAAGKDLIFLLADTLGTKIGLPIPTLNLNTTGYAGQILTVKNETNSNFYLTFVDSNNTTADAESIYTDSDLYYNPLTNLLTVPKLTVSAASAFNFTGIETATSDAARPVWFAISGASGVPCVNANKFTYNPGTNTLKVGALDGPTIIIGDTTLYINSTGTTNKLTPDTSISNLSTNGTIPSSKAVWDAILSGMQANDAMVFKGFLTGGADIDHTAYTPGADRGDTYKVQTAGYINGNYYQVNDTFICTTDGTVAADSNKTTAQMDAIKANWGVIEGNGDYLSYKGGTMYGTLSWDGTTALPTVNTASNILVVDSNTTKQISLANLLVSLNLSPLISNGTANNTVKITVGGIDSSDYTVPYATDSTYLKLINNTTANYSDSAKGKSSTFSVYGLSGNAPKTEYGNGPSTGDGYFAVFNWNDSYVTQIAIDLDPTYRIAIRNYSSGADPKWNAWKNILTANTTYVSSGYGYIEGTEITKVNWASNADTLDGINSDRFIRIISKDYKNTTIDANALTLYNTLYFSEGDVQSSVTWSNFPVNRTSGGWYVLNLAMNEAYRYQIFSCYDEGHLYVRRLTYFNSAPNWNDWYKVAFISDLPTKSSWNYDDIYLKLSGGTLTSASGTTPLTIKGGNGYYSCINFLSKNGTFRTLGIKESDGTLFVTDNSAWSHEYAIYHEGNNNIGTGATNYAAGDHTHNSMVMGNISLQNNCVLLDNFIARYVPNCTATGNDGYIMTLSTGTNYALLYVDVDKTYNMSIRQKTSSTDWNAWVPIITGNNIGSQSVAYATNSDKVDNLHATDFIRIIDNKNLSYNADNMTLANTLYISGGDMYGLNVTWSNMPVNKPDGSSALLHIFEGSYARQILTSYNDQHLWTRRSNYSSGVKWGDWYQIAYITDNVASSDKLKIDTSVSGSDNAKLTSGYNLKCYGVTSSNTAPGGDGYILTFNWGSSYYTQIAVDLDPTYLMGIRGWNSSVGWKEWRNILTGTEDSSGNITVIGNCTAVNFYTTSDRNKKTNISSFSEHIRKFQLKDTEKWHYGVIAQEVPEIFRDGEEGNMTVNYNSILSFYIGQLENKVKILEERIKRLESK